ncbi:50S ribosomal protein L18 [Candidatus Oleimmundimicrobium sp.]|uniref:50S ribosomal protein L18 n=1 Tax=Candidatus Oleimmundimicrobium sp. TaxID=3060597 RepID=UPI0027204828|nr:50S ribosomal protein L18 [Candidatus Oleimmundimicrobium sp.]MDO8886047.1 50S ribosomal protein L18 [Candidatus Oleimmundimicrobium sp.]
MEGIMAKTYKKVLARKRRHRRVRKNLIGTLDKPRLCVYRSNKNIYAQIIDDTKGITLASASSLDKELKGKLPEGGKDIEAAKEVGVLISKKAKKKGIKEVVFDRGGYLYHGKVKSLAEAARDGGLKF